MYRESQTAIHREKKPRTSIPGVLGSGLFLAGYFTFLPIFLTIVLNWVVASFTMNNFYQESWMMPLLLLLSTFLAGAFIRQKMEDEIGGMGLFVMAVLALLVFTLLSYYDMTTHGGVYSRMMPKILPYSAQNYLYFLPGVGLLGMLFYKYFTLKNYG